MQESIHRALENCLGSPLGVLQNRCDGYDLVPSLSEPQFISPVK